MKHIKKTAYSLTLCIAILCLSSNSVSAQNIFKSGDLKLIEEISSLVRPAEVKEFLSKTDWKFSEEKTGPPVHYIFKNNAKELRVDFTTIDPSGYKSGLRVMLIRTDGDYDTFSNSMKEYGFRLTSTTRSDNGQEISVTTWKKATVDMYFMFLHKVNKIALVKNEPKIVSFND